MFFTYFAKSLRNGKVYVGYTGSRPDQRIKEHNQGSNKWTKENGPFKLVYYESYLCEEDAKFRENFYKTGIGKKVKKSIISAFEN